MNRLWGLMVLPVMIVLTGCTIQLVQPAGEGDIHEFAPVPDTVWGPQIDSEKGYFVEELSAGLYWVTEGTYQMMFLTTGEGVIVVDAPPAIGPNILNAIAEVTDEPITHVVYSHTHADHIGAAGIYPEDAIVIAHVDTAFQLENGLAPEREFPYGVFSGGGPVPLPTVTFDTDYTLKVGNQVLELSYKGINHEPGNIFIYAPAHLHDLIEKLEQDAFYT